MKKPKNSHRPVEIVDAMIYHCLLGSNFPYQICSCLVLSGFAGLASCRNFPVSSGIRYCRTVADADTSYNCTRTLAQTFSSAKVCGMQIPLNTVRLWARPFVNLVVYFSEKFMNK